MHLPATTTACNSYAPALVSSARIENVSEWLPAERLTHSPSTNMYLYRTKSCETNWQRENGVCSCGQKAKVDFGGYEGTWPSCIYSIVCGGCVWNHQCDWVGLWPLTGVWIFDSYSSPEWANTHTRRKLCVLNTTHNEHFDSIGLVVNFVSCFGFVSQTMYCLGADELM